jgi:hypothetical protein
MRDHPLHAVTILGSGWGCKLFRNEIRNSWKRTWREMFKEETFWADRSLNGPDQELLQRFVQQVLVFFSLLFFRCMSFHRITDNIIIWLTKPNFPDPNITFYQKLLQNYYKIIGTLMNYIVKSEIWV